METTFDFEEMQLPEFGEGVLFYGQATLSDDMGETDHFIVTEIRLAGGRYLRRPSREANTFSQMLFREIELVLYDEKTVMGRHAAQEWSDFVSGSMQEAA